MGSHNAICGIKRAMRHDGGNHNNNSTSLSIVHSKLSPTMAYQRICQRPKRMPNSDDDQVKQSSSDAYHQSMKRFEHVRVSK